MWLRLEVELEKFATPSRGRRNRPARRIRFGVYDA